jgi:hypothetical protein
MKLKQVSVFLENRPGSLTIPCRLLAEAGINILTFALADTHQFGILRLVVGEPERARQVLEQGGCVVKLTEVVPVEVPDQPGGLDSVLRVIERDRINVEYVYAFTIKVEHKGVLVFRFSDPDQAIRLLQAAGVVVVSESDLKTRLGA